MPGHQSSSEIKFDPALSQLLGPPKKPGARALRWKRSPTPGLGSAGQELIFARLDLFQRGSPFTIPGTRCRADGRGMANPPDMAFRSVTALHQLVFRVSRGRLLNRFYGMPVVMLTTTGRRSGKRRTTMLTSPVREGGRIVLVASKGGADHHPTWFLNLRTYPDVEVTMEGRTRRMRARVATTEEKAELWPRVTGAYRGYGQYQQRTARDIPVVILEP